MPDLPDWTILLTGPLAQRAPLLAVLDRSKARLEADNTQRGHPHGFADDDPTVGWVTVRHSDIDELARPANPATKDPGGLAVQRGWRLAAHWPTPDCQVCAGTGKVNHGTTGQGACLHCNGDGRTNLRPPSPEEQLRSTIDDLTARLSALEAKG